MSDFGEYAYPVARKNHRCEWCGESIPAGEKYVRYVGMWESEFQNWAMHQECHDAASMSDDIYDGFAPFEAERPEKADYLTETSAK